MIEDSPANENENQAQETAPSPVLQTGPANQTNNVNEDEPERRQRDGQSDENKQVRMFSKKWWNEHEKVILGLANIDMAAFTFIAIVIATKSFKASDRAASFADSAFHETKKEFDIQNEAYLQIGDVMYYFTEDNVAKFKYRISNLGKSPAKIAYNRFWIWWTRDAINKFPFTPDLDNINKVPVNYYSIGEGSNPTFALSWQTVSLDKHLVDSVNAGKGFFYFGGDLEYTNEITKNVRVYSFVVLLQQQSIKIHGKEIKAKFVIDYKYNDNYSVHKQQSK